MILHVGFTITSFSDEDEKNPDIHSKNVKKEEKINMNKMAKIAAWLLVALCEDFYLISRMEFLSEGDGILFKHDTNEDFGCSGCRGFFVV